MITTLLCSLLLHATNLPADYRLPPPPGPYAKPVAGDAADSGGFTSGKALVATTYFCWYDEASNAHIVDYDGSDALTDHPPTLDGFSYKNVDWHISQFRDMRYLYFDAHPRFLCGGDETVDVVVTYFDDAAGAFHLEYDSADELVEGPARQFLPTRAETLKGENRWKRAAFTLRRARFADGCNGGDFRIACDGRDLMVREIIVRRRGEGRSSR